MQLDDQSSQEALEQLHVLHQSVAHESGRGELEERVHLLVVAVDEFPDLRDRQIHDVQLIVDPQQFAGDRS